MLRLAALLLLSILLAPGQSPPARRKAAPARKPAVKTETAEPGWKIESIGVEGNRSYTAQQVLQVARLHVGQTVTKKDFDVARDRLIAAGAFENAGYRYGPSADRTGYDVVLEVQEVQPLYPYKFEDLPAEPKEMQAALEKTDLLFGPRIPATETLLKRYTAALQQYLNGKGFTGKVTARVSVENVSDLMVVFRPESSPENIAEVHFTGTSAVPATELQRQIHDVAVGSVYQESRFREYLATTILPIYERLGRLRVSFPTLTREKATDVKGLVVTVAVKEGDVYTLGEVNVEGTTAKAKFKTGEVANMLGVQESIGQIQTQLRRQGYLKVAVQVDRKFDDAKHVVNLTVHVTPGPQYTFGELQIQGLDIIGEAAMRKMWTLQPGKPFDAVYADFFLQRVREEGLFDNLGDTKSVVKVDDENRTADVTLLFRGAPMPERKGRRGPYR